jgi:hypothetical protein
MLIRGCRRTMTPSLRSYQRQCCQANTNGTGRSDGNEEADVDYEGPSPLPFHFHFLPLTILSLLSGRHSNGGRSGRDGGACFFSEPYFRLQAGGPTSSSARMRSLLGRRDRTETKKRRKSDVPIRHLRLTLSAWPPLSPSTASKNMSSCRPSLQPSIIWPTFDVPQAPCANRFLFRRRKLLR